MTILLPLQWINREKIPSVPRQTTPGTHKTSKMDSAEPHPLRLFHDTRYASRRAWPPYAPVIISSRWKTPITRAAALSISVTILRQSWVTREYRQSKTILSRRSPLPPTSLPRIWGRTRARSNRENALGSWTRSAGGSSTGRPAFATSWAARGISPPSRAPSRWRVAGKNLT